jgi:DNA-binding response OmpR family regulator
MGAHILVVEDDMSTRISMTAVLEGAGYLVSSAADGEKAILLLEQDSDDTQPYDVVITDIRMGNVDGIEVLHAARSREHPPEVVILTGFGTMDTSIAALRAGAYDYLIKPCEPTDLLAYIAGAVHRRVARLNEASVLRTITEAIGQLHAQQSQSEPGDLDMPPPPPPAPSLPPAPTERYIEVGSLLIDSFQHTVSFDGESLHLTPIEYGLLRCLAQAEGRVLEYCEIARRTHGHVADKVEAHALLKPHVHNLRRKIAPDYLVNVRGVGYMLVCPNQSEESS